MSRFPQRWRTQRNAIRNANCKTSWIIKILNAHCAFGIFPVACLFECLWTPLSVDVFQQLDLCECLSLRMDSYEMFVDGCWASIVSGFPHSVLCWELNISSISGNTLRVEWVLARSLVFNTFNTGNEIQCFLSKYFVQSNFCTRYNSFRISNQARRPAEFKHIIKRRKRN